MRGEAWQLTGETPAETASPQPEAELEPRQRQASTCVPLALSCKNGHAEGRMQAPIELLAAC